MCEPHVSQCIGTSRDVRSPPYVPQRIGTSRDVRSPPDASQHTGTSRDVRSPPNVSQCIRITLHYIKSYLECPKSLRTARTLYEIKEVMWENIWRKDKFLNGYRKQAEFVRI